MTLLADTPTTGFTLRPDQVEARDSILQSLAEHDRTLFVSACGTGKTVTLHSIVDERRADGSRVNTLIAAFFPSIALVDQTLRSWKSQYGNLWATPVVVCSDQTAGRTDDDELEVPDEELEAAGAIVTRDAQEIADILTRHRARAIRVPLVVFSTYQSADKVAEAMTLAPEVVFDIAVLDEAHRAKSLGEAGKLTLDGWAIRARKRVAATATPKVTHLARHHSDYEAVTDLDMVVDRDFGPIAHNFGLRDAINAGILVDYEIRIMVISLAEYAAALGVKKVDPAEIDPGSADTRMYLGVAALHRMMQQGMDRTIAYFSSRDRARQFAALNHALDVAKVDVITGDMPMRSTTLSNGRVRPGRDVILERLKNDGGAVANVRCLTEGVDIPELDAVLFVDPRTAKVDIVQAVGRAIRRGSLGKKRGYVVLPVLEAPEYADIDEWQDRSGFQRLWDVLREMAENDTAMREVVTHLAAEAVTAQPRYDENGTLIGAGTITGGGFWVDMPIPEPKTEVVETGDEEPDPGNDATETPGKGPVGGGGGEGPRPWTPLPWCVTVGTDDENENENEGKRKPVTPPPPPVPEPYALLFARALIGSTTLRAVKILDRDEADFPKRLAELRAFIAEHGEAPKQRGARPGEAKLAKWRGKHAQDRKNGRIQPGDPKDMALTEVLGDMWWDQRERDYQENLADLRAFTAEHGEAPKGRGTRPGEARLGTWVNKRAEDRKTGRIQPGDPKDVALTEILGDLWWDRIERDYLQSLADLRAFIAEHGEAPKWGGARPGEAKLAMWVTSRARDRKTGHIQPGDPKDVALTEILGDLWWDRIERDYLQSLADLRAFIAEHGEAPKRNGTRPGEARLALWVRYRAKDRKDGRITPGSPHDLDMAALFGPDWWVSAEARDAAVRERYAS